MGPYFRVLKRKYYDDDDYEAFQMLILMMSVNMPTTVFKISSFEFIILVLTL
jgi:hypothetical protein